MGQRGPKLLTARDWLFGSRPRRLALATILSPRPPEAGWTREQLAAAAEVSLRGVDAHLDGFRRLGLIERTATGYRAVRPSPELAGDLRRLLRTLEQSVEDDR